MTIDARSDSKYRQTVSEAIALVPAPTSRAATLGGYATSHDNNYDFLRFALASSVVFAHGFHAVNRSNTFYEPLLGPTRDQLQLGHLAVNGFFAISGWLVTTSWDRSAGVYDYLRKRVLRIYPGFIVCYLFCLLVVAPLSGLTWAEYRAEFNAPVFLFKMILLRGFGGFYAFPHNGQHMLNTSLWTIPVEFGCYLIVAALGLLGAHRKPLVFVGAALGYVALLVEGLPQWSFLPTLPQPLLHVAATVSEMEQYFSPTCYFLIGASFYLLKDRIPCSGKLAAIALAACVVAARLPPLLGLVLPVCVPYLIFFFVYDPRIDVRHFGRRADLSYGIYLFGWPIQQMIARFLPWLNGVELFVLTMPVVCAVAFASWTFVEGPCLRLKRARVVVDPTPAVN
jgi:peptidoglycan/LPS O-acetylase OafA/YrhL